jgi:GDP-4-dehydro-6-deoxy-D-mannose reductase
VRALITGASGFAGAWLCRECAAAGDEVLALSRRGTVPDGCGRGIAVDLCDGAAVQEAVRAAAPDVVYHLAALTSVGRSWQDPARTLADNVGGSIHLLEALRQLGDDAPRVIWVGSCEVYGQAPALPVSEQVPIQPANPYAVSKAAGEMLAQVYRDAYGLDVVRARPFSHSGPGQAPVYLLSNLSRQAVEGRRAGVRTLHIVTGNPNTRRDFTDVRDVVVAYRSLIVKGVAGTTYNVCSGRDVAISDVADQLLALAHAELELVIDPELVRPVDVPVLRGDASLLHATTGWSPSIPLATTLADVLASWESD